MFQKTFLTVHYGPGFLTFASKVKIRQQAAEIVNNNLKTARIRESQRLQKTSRIIESKHPSATNIGHNMVQCSTKKSHFYPSNVPFMLNVGKQYPQNMSWVVQKNIVPGWRNRHRRSFTTAHSCEIGSGLQSQIQPNRQRNHYDSSQKEDMLLCKCPQKCLQTWGWYYHFSSWGHYINLAYMTVYLKKVYIFLGFRRVVWKNSFKSINSKKPNFNCKRQAQ